MKKLYKILHQRKKILITGGLGFIGGALIRKLLIESSCSVYNLDKSGYASDESSINDLISTNINLKNRYKYLRVDLANSIDTLNAVKVSDPDLIIHLAAESHVDNSILNAFPFIQSNIVGTYNILEASKIHFQNLSEERKQIFRFHHVSTDEVFGSLSEGEFFSEESRYDPKSPYSASKASSDHLVRAWGNTYKIPFIITNCSNNFGPWQFPEKLIPLAITSAIEGKIIPIYGDGKNVRDWLFVEDHIMGLLLAGNNGSIGESYCIGGIGEKSNLEIINCICNILDELFPLKNPHKELIKFVKDRPGHDKRYAIKADKIIKELGWKPAYNLELGLKETINWYLKNRNWWLPKINKK